MAFNGFTDNPITGYTRTKQCSYEPPPFVSECVPIEPNYARELLYGGRSERVKKKIDYNAFTLEELEQLMDQVSIDKNRVVREQRYEEANMLRDKERALLQAIDKKHAVILNAFNKELNELMLKHGVEEHYDPDGVVSYVVTRKSK